MKRIPALIFAVLALAVAACDSVDTGVCPDPPCTAGTDSTAAGR
jgi:hypothetical protein